MALFLFGGAGLAAGMLLGAAGFDADAGQASGILPFAQFITQLGGLGFLVIGVTAVAAFVSGSRTYLRLLVAFMAFQVVGGFVAGYKSQSLAPLLLTGLVYVAVRQRLPWRAIALTAGVTFLVLIPANSVYRTVIRPNPNVETAGNSVDGRRRHARIREVPVPADRSRRSDKRQNACRLRPR